MTADILQVELQKAAQALSHGELVAYPTETFYGLGADPESPAAIERLIAAKGREPGKAIALIAPNAASAFDLFAIVPSVAQRLAARFWPGPLTLVLPGRPGLHPALCSHYGVGVRVSSHPIAGALAHAFGRSITATSANLAGLPATIDADEVRRAFRDKIKILLEYRTMAIYRAPSTIVTVDGNNIEVLREGAIATAQLQLALAEA